MATALFRQPVPEQGARNDTALLKQIAGQFLTLVLFEPPGLGMPEMRRLLKLLVADLPHRCASLVLTSISNQRSRALAWRAFGSVQPGLAVFRRGRLLRLPGESVERADSVLSQIAARAWRECRDFHWRASALPLVWGSAGPLLGFRHALLLHLERLPWMSFGRNASSVQQPPPAMGFDALHAGWARMGAGRLAFIRSWVDLDKPWASHLQRVVVVTNAFRLRRRSLPRAARGKVWLVSTSALQRLPTQVMRTSWFIICPAGLGALAHAASRVVSFSGWFDAALVHTYGLGHPRQRPKLAAPPEPRAGVPARLPWVVWLHVPKTGTSFMRAVYHYACQPAAELPALSSISAASPDHFDQELMWASDFRCIPGRTANGMSTIGLAPGQRNHRWSVTRLREFPGRAITMLRHPTARIRSAYRSLLGHRVAAELYLCGTCGGSVQGSSREQLNVARKVLSGELSFQAFSQLGAIRSCYTKLLLGTTCLPANAAQLAIKRLRQDFFFIGLSEHWALSVCLFHAMMDGLQPHSSEFANSRPTPSVLGVPLANELHMEGRDVLDEQVYDSAVDWFGKRVESYASAIIHLGSRCHEELSVYLRHRAGMAHAEPLLDH